jgi:hypothetical protein
VDSKDPATAVLDVRGLLRASEQNRKVNKWQHVAVPVSLTHLAEVDLGLHAWAVGLRDEHLGWSRPASTRVSGRRHRT